MWTIKGGSTYAVWLLRRPDAQRRDNLPRSFRPAELGSVPKRAGTRAGTAYRARLGAGCDLGAGARIIAERIA